MQVYLLGEELERGGVGRNIVDIANGLTSLGRNVTVIAPIGPLRFALDSRVTFEELPSLRQTAVGKWQWYRIVRSRIATILISDPGIIHSHKRLSDFVANAAVKGTKARHVSTCHSSFADLRFFSRFGEWTIGVTARVSEQLVRHYGLHPGRVQTIYNGVKPLSTRSAEEKRRIREAVGLDRESRVILSVGHFSPAKDRMTLLRMVELLFSDLRERGALLLLVGEGPLRQHAERFVDQHGLKDIVRFLRSDAPLDELWNCAEFGVLSSRQEGLPYVILDAATLGLPHVATNVGGVADFVKDGETGTLVQQGDVQSLGRAIMQMLDDEVYREKCGMNARALVIRQHDPERFIANLCALYDEASAS